MPKVVLLLGAGIFAGWLVVRSAAVDALLRRNPLGAAAFAPSDPRVKIALAMAEFRSGNGAIRPSAAKSANDALGKSPLIEEPFLLAAVSALAGKKEGLAERLLLEARVRNPRSRTTRILLLDRYLRTERVNEAATEIAALSRLIPAARQALVPELAKFANDGSTRASLAHVLRGDPAIREEVLNHLARTQGATEVLALATSSAAPILPNDVRPWQHTLIDKLVADGDFRPAYDLWRQFAGIDSASDAKGVYDGRFQGLPGAPPFNWEYVSSAAGVAEKASGPAIQVEYYGRHPTLLASQLLMLAPGAHRLAFRAEGDAPGEGGVVAWRIECLPSKAELATLPIRNVGYAGKVIAGQFTVPAPGCSAQWLRLVGLSAEFPVAQSLSITDVQMSKAGRP